EDWASHQILDWCRDETVNRGQSPNDVDTFSVYYNDCEAPWIMCRHKDSSVSKQQIIDTFGRLPVGIREHVRHVGVWGSLEYAGFMSGLNVAFTSSFFNIWVVIHETMHAVDADAFRHFGSPFSSTDMWKDAYNQDSRVPADNSHSSWAEHFADIAPHTIWNRNVPGGLEAVHPHWREVGNSIDLLTWAFGDENLTPGG
ncbi:hypothetical protein B0I35DRAFT_328090, partial [Stachybotrys elegans]